MCTFQLHARYIRKVLSMDLHRFPRIVAEEITKEGMSWAGRWRDLAGKYGVLINLNTTDYTTLHTQIRSLVDHMRANVRNKFKERANSTHSLQFINC